MKRTLLSLIVLFGLAACSPAPQTPTPAPSPTTGDSTAGTSTPGTSTAPDGPTAEVNACQPFSWVLDSGLTRVALQGPDCFQKAQRWVVLAAGADFNPATVYKPGFVDAHELTDVVPLVDLSIRDGDRIWVRDLQPDPGFWSPQTPVEVLAKQDVVQPLPSGLIQWDWELTATAQHPVSVPAGVTLLDVDGWNTTAGEVQAILAKGAYPVCYIDAGSYEPNRPDSSQYPAYLKLKQDPDWPAEYFLDIRDVKKQGSVLASILNARLAMCKAKGFKALEPDNLQNAENATGKGLTLQDQLDFDAWVADAARAHGLRVLQKNDPDQVLSRSSDGRQLVDLFDGILNEQCQQYKECSGLSQYTSRGKLALDTEYKASLTLGCAAFRQQGVSAIKRDLDLTTPGTKSYKRSGC